MRPAARRGAPAVDPDDVAVAPRPALGPALGVVHADGAPGDDPGDERLTGPEPHLLGALGLIPPQALQAAPRDGLVEQRPALAVQQHAPGEPRVLVRVQPAAGAAAVAAARD